MLIIIIGITFYLEHNSKESHTVQLLRRHQLASRSRIVLQIQEIHLEYQVQEQHNRAKTTKVLYGANAYNRTRGDKVHTATVKIQEYKVRPQ